MALRLVHTSGDNSSSLLKQIEFLNDDAGRFFKLSNRSFEIKVQYIPDFISDWDPERYTISIFENPYLTAENDIYQLYEATSKESRLGWIFPLSSLESNENDYVNNKYFKHYRYVAYWKLFDLEFDVKYVESKPQYQLSEIFPNNICICILSKDEIEKIADFKIEQYALSFLKFDYLLFKGQIKGNAIFDKSTAVNGLRAGNHKLIIRKSTYDFQNNDFTKSLFLDHLYQSENFLVRYVFLYQILEFFIQKLADEKFDELIEGYKRGRTTKNNLRESINRFSNDRTLIKKIFEGVPIDKDVKKSFVEKCEYLFQDISIDLEKSSLEEILYDFRNLVTHNYRIVSQKVDQLREITYYFELIILDLLINYNDRTSSNDVAIVSAGKKASKQVANNNRAGWLNNTWLFFANNWTKFFGK